MFIKTSESAAAQVRAIDVVVQIDTGDEPRIKLVCNANGHGAMHFQIKIHIPISLSLMNPIPLRIYMSVHCGCKGLCGHLTLPQLARNKVARLVVHCLSSPPYPTTLNSTRNLQHPTAPDPSDAVRATLAKLRAEEDEAREQREKMMAEVEQSGRDMQAKVNRIL